MGKVIWKAILKATEVQEVSVPTGAEFLCVREQFEQACIWFRCDPDAPIEKRKIAIVGTGNSAPADGTYLGTAFLLGGQLVLHAFDWSAQTSAESTP